MKKHHTKEKGDIGVLKVKLDLRLKGLITCSPDTEHAPFDIIVYDGNNKKLYRIQCKYRNKVAGSVLLHFRSTYADKNGSHDVPIDKNDIDCWAIYCPDTDKIYYIDPKKYNKSINLRVDANQNGHEEKHKIENFLIFPPI